MPDDLADHLAPSGALLAAQIALGAAIADNAVAHTDHDATSLDLLVRLRLAPDRRLRGVELANQLALSPSHVSRMLDRIEAAGLVRREPDPHDRRARQVAMTDDGEAAVETFVPLLQAVLDETIHEVLDTEEIATLVTLLERITAASRAAVAEPTR